MITESRSYVSPYATQLEEARTPAPPAEPIPAVAYSAAVRYSADAEHPASLHNPVAAGVAPQQVADAVFEVAVAETPVIDVAAEIVAALPTEQLTQQVYELVRARVLESIGAGANWTVAFRSSSDTDTFFSDTMAEMIARDVASRLLASTTSHLVA